MLNFLLLAASGAGTGTGTGTADAGGTNIGQIISLVVIVVALIGFFIWQTISNKKKQKEAQKQVDGLKIGDRVLTIGGICGFVAEINNNENTFVLETGKEDAKSYVKFDKAAIYKTSPAEGSAYAGPEVKEEKPAQEVKEEPKAE